MHARIALSAVANALLRVPAVARNENLNTWPQLSRSLVFDVVPLVIQLAVIQLKMLKAGFTTRLAFVFVKLCCHGTVLAEENVGLASEAFWANALRIKIARWYTMGNVPTRSVS